MFPLYLPNDLLRKGDKPCPRCPYVLGLIKTVVSPCPQCEANGYKTYETFWAQLGRPTGREG